MKFLTSLCIFIFFLPFVNHSRLQAQNALEKQVALSVTNLPIQQILDSLEVLADISFAYDRRKIPMEKKVTLGSSNTSLAIILDQLFNTSGIEYAASDNQVSLFRVHWPNYTLYGQIKDEENGEALIGANIYDTIQFQGASSDIDGYYSLTLPEGRYVLFTSYIGFQDRVDTIDLFEDQYMDVMLEHGADLVEVVVIDKLVKLEAIAALRRSGRAEEVVDANHAKSLPTASGEADPLAIVRLLPGFIAGGTNRQNSHVRGGNADQNLVLLDGVPLYHTNRSNGNFSIFNGAAINEIKTYTSNIPAQYGDRLSSVIDVKTREGNDQEFHGGAMIGLSSGSLHAEGPIIKNKASFLIAGRRSWSDIIQLSLNGTRSLFYDINAKVNFRLSQKDRFHASFYNGKDEVLTKNSTDIDPTSSTENNQETRWTNTAATLRWHRKINPRFFTNYSVQLSTFDHRNNNESLRIENDISNLESEFKYSSFVREVRFLADAVYIPSVKHQVSFGGQYTFRTADPGRVSSFVVRENENFSQTDEIEKISANEAMLFVEEEFKLSDHWSFRGGLRLSYLAVQEEHFLRPQLRANVRYAFNKHHHAELSFDQTVQFMHLLSIAGSNFENEKWLPSTKRVKPSEANQVSMNYIMTSTDWKMKIGAYYKKSESLLFFDQNNSVFDSYKNWEEQITAGSGEAMGLEFLLAKLNGKTNGWLSYAWSNSTLKFPSLNQGLSFPHRYDRRHKLNFVVTHSIKPKPKKTRYIGIVWSIASGHWVTLPSDYSIDPVSGFRIPIFEEVNNAQLPLFHQLNISINKNRKTTNGNLVTWRYGIQNFYLRNNEDQPSFTFDQQTDQYILRESAGLDLPTLFFSFSYTF